MIFPGDIKAPKFLQSIDSLSNEQGPLFEKAPNLQNGEPLVMDLAEAMFIDSLEDGLPPTGNFKGKTEESLKRAIGASAQSLFGLNLQTLGAVGNGKVIEGIGGLASDLNNPKIKDAFEKSLNLPKLSQGLGSAQFQTTRLYGSAALSIIDNVFQTVGPVANSKDPGKVAAAVTSATLGAASAVLMMVPSPFGITQIIGSVLTAVNALVNAFTGKTEREKISKAVLYKKSIVDDVVIAQEILTDHFKASGVQTIALSRGEELVLKDGAACDLNRVFLPKYSRWHKGDDKKGRKAPWTGYQQVRSEKKKQNVAVIFEAGSHSERADPVNSWEGTDKETGIGFMPGTMRMQLQMQVPFDPMEDRQGNVVRELSQLKKKNNDKNKDAIPYREIERDSGMLGTFKRPFAWDLGGNFPITNNLCSNIWSTIVNRPGPLMYSVDVEKLNDAWRIYFESFYERAQEWWSESKGLAWRSAVLKVCSLMTVDWDDVTCSWRATGEVGRLPSHWMGQSPKDSQLKLKWSHSIYEQIIRPALINLAERQYEYLHTSLVAYLPAKAAAYNGANSKIGKTFREARRWLANHELKQYLSMDDVIDPRYREQLGPSAGSKAANDTPVIFAIADGLKIPAPSALAGGAPGSLQQSYMTKNMTLASARKYGSTSPQFQRQMNLMEECAGKGPYGDGLRTLCESAYFYDLLKRQP